MARGSFAPRTETSPNGEGAALAAPDVSADVDAAIDRAYEDAISVTGSDQRYAWEDARDQLLSVALAAGRMDAVSAAVRIHVFRLLEKCRFPDAEVEMEWARGQLAEESGLRAELDIMQAVVDYYQDRLADAEGALAGVSAQYEELDVRARLDFDTTSVYVDAFRFDPDAQRRCLRLIDSLEGGTEPVPSMVPMVLSWLQFAAGEPINARRSADVAVQSAHDGESVRQFRLAERDVVTAADLLRRGLLEEFEEHIEVGLERARSAANRRELRRLLLLRWRSELLHYRSAAAAVSWGEADALSDRIPPLYTAARVGLEAWAAANVRVPADLWRGYGMFGWDGVLAGAERAASDRRSHSAKRLAEQLLSAKQRGYVCGFIWHVSVDRVLALLYLRMGQGSKALEAFSRAMAWAEAHESHVEYAMAAAQYAEVAEVIDRNVAPQEVRAIEEEALALLGSWDFPAEPIALQAARAWMASKQKSKRLTEAQRSVTELAARELTRAQIAELLGISPETVKRHQADVRGKYGVRTMESAVAIAKKLGDI